MVIEAGLYSKLTLSEIGKKINKNAKYVSEELRRNRTITPGVKPHDNDCIYAAKCQRVGLCGENTCLRKCVQCLVMDCRNLCPRYSNSPCRQLKRPHTFAICANREGDARLTVHITLPIKLMQWQRNGILQHGEKLRWKAKNWKNSISWYLH